MNTISIVEILKALELALKIMGAPERYQIKELPPYCADESFDERV